MSGMTSSIKNEVIYKRGNMRTERILNGNKKLFCNISFELEWNILRKNLLTGTQSEWDWEGLVGKWFYNGSFRVGPICEIIYTWDPTTKQILNFLTLA